jgi:hypothetical protein
VSVKIQGLVYSPSVSQALRTHKCCHREAANYDEEQSKLFLIPTQRRMTVILSHQGNELCHFCIAELLAAFVSMVTTDSSVCTSRIRQARRLYTVFVLRSGSSRLEKLMSG